jgi:hypothetical protein
MFYKKGLYQVASNGSPLSFQEFIKILKITGAAILREKRFLHFHNWLILWPPLFFLKTTTMIYAKTLRKIIICPTCQGEGTIKVGNLREMHNQDTEPCRDCGTKGKIRRIVTIEYQKL